MRKKIKAFSLVETMVTLAIFGILMAMLSQVLLLNLEVSRKISARTRIREELSALVGLLQRDMRNAGHIVLEECGDNLKIDNWSGVNGCKMSHVESFVWVNNEHDLCKKANTAVQSLCRIVDGEITFRTSDVLNIDSISFQSSQIEDEKGTKKATIIVTIIASAANPSWDVTDQVRQIVVTTRNF